MPTWGFARSSPVINKKNRIVTDFREGLENFQLCSRLKFWRAKPKLGSPYKSMEVLKPCKIFNRESRTEN
ncbi:MAG: hypothetical protein DRR19_22910 [Candidatus Parabeggiatoa sp. nov. 1]|nr:MAG: hypothetical protein DRR19_22910 [Gammaproteobacteria bacterium]